VNWEMWVARGIADSLPMCMKPAAVQNAAAKTVFYQDNLFINTRKDALFAKRGDSLAHLFTVGDDS